MKETPILFSTEMVRAILDRRKTQTRRVIKSQPHYIIWSDDGQGPDDGYYLFNKKDRGNYSCEGQDATVLCPYGQPGDRLWVKEAWAETTRISDPLHNGGNGLAAGIDSGLYYKADRENLPHGMKWRSARFMPKRVARIWLEIDEIRIERVQDITLGDIAAEGNANLPKENEEWICNLPELQKEFDWFIELWNRINAKRGFGWDVNPWVWVIKFHRIFPE